MDITQSDSNGLKHNYTITVPPERIEQMIKSRLIELGKNAKIPGFRPGKIPMQVLQNRYEESARQEVVQKALDDGFRHIVSAKALHPAGKPEITIESYGVNDGLVCRYDFEVLPQIESVDLKTAVNVTHHVAEIDEVLVDDSLQKIAKNNKKTAPLEEKRAAQEGDTLLIDFDGHTKDGPITGGSGKGINIELGAGYFIPGFEEQLIGTNVGDEKEVIVTFPENYEAKDVAGKEAKFQVTVQDVLATVVPEMTDTLAEEFGFDSLEALRTAVRKQLERDNAQLSFGAAKREILDQLDKITFEVPEVLVRAEMAQLDPEHAYHKKEDGTAQISGDNKEDAQKKFDELKRISERRVRLGLLLADIGNKNKIQVTQKEMQEAMVDYARKFPGKEKETYEQIQQNNQLQQMVRAPIYEDKVIAHILENGTIVTEKVTRPELEEIYKKVTAADTDTSS